MIKKIKRIKNFGIFSDFSVNNEVKDFSKYNLIYGWNYSGKTTLSRIFRCFEQGCIPPDFIGASFELIDTDEIPINEQYLEISHIVRVFNSDFVEDNLKWNNDLEPIFLIGQDSIEKEEELRFEKDNLQILSESVLGIKNTIQEIEKNISEALTVKAKDIKQTLSIPDYNKTKFESKIVAMAADFADYVLTDSQLNDTHAEYFSNDKKPKISQIDKLVFDTNKLQQNVDKLLKTTIASKTIERLRENEVLQKWVGEGLAIHEGKDSCEFCGGKLTQELLDKLNLHFSDEFDSLMREINFVISALEKRKLELNFIDSANLYNELKEEYEKNILEASGIIQLFNEQLSNIIQSLVEKRGKAFTEMQAVDLSDYTSKLNENLESINIIITLHNNKTDNFDKIRKGNLEKIILHSCAKHIIDTDYFQKIEHRNSNLLSLSNLQATLGESKSRVSELESVLSEVAQGADKINEYLRSFFGKNDLQISVNEENKFQLHRKGIIAKNLSEGEKTAIAFAYFVAKLEDKNTKIKDTIVYLDDPISSLDSNHIFNIYAFIKAKLSSSKQLFISTHNSEFFNIIKDWYSDERKKKALFLVERSTNVSVDQSSLKNIPLLMDKYKSEYVYLFSVINDFKNGPCMDFHMLYNLPNIMRRFLESYASFKIPKSAGLFKKLEILFPDPIKLERVNKFVQQNSHTSSINSGVQFPNLTEVSDVIDLIFEMVISKDSDHFSYLLDAVAGNTDL